MSSPTILRKLGDKASDFAGKIKSIAPDENEYRGLEAANENIDAATGKSSPKKEEAKPATASPAERVNPKAKYGSGPGEIRFSEEQLKEMTHPLGQVAVPLYDQGGDVKVDDGQHQLAVLENGERVLTPEQAQAQDAMQSASEQPTGDMSGKKPRMNPESPLGKMLQQDKEEAAQKGDLVGLGKAVLSEHHLANPFGRGQQEGSVVSNLQNPFGAKPAAPSPAALGGAIATAGDTGTMPATPAATPAPMSRKDKLADYDKQIQDALDKAAKTNDPAYQEQADRLKLAKLEYAKSTHLGTPENHPGILGKLGHIAAGIGNIAGDIVAPSTMELIPGTQLHGEVERGRLGQAIGTDVENRLKQEEEQYKREALEAGKTPEQKDFNSLLKTINPATGKLYTNDEALQQVKSSEADAKEKEGYIAAKAKEYMRDGATQEEARIKATEAYYAAKAGAKPPTNELERRMSDRLKAKGLPDSPANREAARNEIIAEDAKTKSEAVLPAAEHKIRLQSQLSEANNELNNIRANALQRGEKADEFTLKENERHNLRLGQIDGAEKALDEAADGNEVAASMVPVIATMTTSNEQGIKRLNANELSRFTPANGSFYRWAESHADKFLAGEIPPEYSNEVRTMLNNMAKDEDVQYNSNLKSIDETIRQGGIQPKVNKGGTATSTKASEPVVIPTRGNAKFHYQSKNGEIFSNDGKTWYDDKGKKVK